MQEFVNRDSALNFIEEKSDICVDSKIAVVTWSCRGEVESYLKDMGNVEEGVLVISDDSKVCNWMCEKAVPVVAVLHGNNARNDFWKIAYAIENLENLNAEYFEHIYRRYRGIPLDILETERCILREITVEDVDRIAKIYESPTVKRFMEPLYSPIEKEKEYTKNYIKNIYGFYEYGMWVIVEKNYGMIIGKAGLESYADNDEEVIELGYLITEEYQRKRYGYEVCKAILNYAKEILCVDFVETNIEKENIASIKLCEKLGFCFVKDFTKIGKKYCNYRYQKHE